MKRMIKLFGVIAFVAVIGFSMASCKQDETDPTPQTVTYEGDAGGVRYTLKITENTARYTAQSGDSYELTVGTRKSNGKVQSVTGGTLTLQPSREGATTFTATVNSSGITAMSGTIAFDVGDPQEAPTTITPPPFKGSWSGTIAEGPLAGQALTIVFDDTTWQYILANNKGQKGTYIYSGYDATMTITHVTENGGGTWSNVLTGLPETTFSSTVSGNTMVMNGTTVTKQ